MKISYGRLLGLVLIGIGIMFFGLGLLLVLTGEYFIVLFATFPLFICFGLAMLIFPGADVPASEVNGKFNLKELLDTKKNQERNKRQRAAMKAAPTGHKVAWVIGGILGIPGTVYVMILLYV